MNFELDSQNLFRILLECFYFDAEKLRKTDFSLVVEGLSGWVITLSKAVPRHNDGVLNSNVNKKN